MDTTLKTIGKELKAHVPFTAFGALTGIVIMVVLSYVHLSDELPHGLFTVFHPLHVMLSAVVTAGMYRLHGRGRWWATILIGYVGSIGIGTLSDCLIPYMGEILLNMPHAHPHIGFIEEWWVVNPAALAGIAIAFFWPKTGFPHAGHVFISTFASLSHMLMAGPPNPRMAALLVAILFLAVWIPCCTSDIVFPLLFAKKTLAGENGHSQQG